jgi:uncharacterized protein YbjT (DUF2867 family)
MNDEDLRKLQRQELRKGIEVDMPDGTTEVVKGTILDADDIPNAMLGATGREVCVGFNIDPSAEAIETARRLIAINPDAANELQVANGQVYVSLCGILRRDPDATAAWKVGPIRFRTNTVQKILRTHTQVTVISIGMFDVLKHGGGE